MELRHLRYFIAAAEEQHFSRAADRLCVTRPAVSRMISDLEEELGTQLFERSAHRIKLTAAGAVMLERLRGVMKELTLTLELTKRVGSGKSGILNIGHGSSTLHHPLFRASIKQVNDEFPDVALSFFEGTHVDQLNALRDGTLHVSFTHSPISESVPKRRSRNFSIPTDDESEFVRLPIQTGRLAVALASSHPLAARKNLKLSDLANEAFINVPLSSTSPSSGKIAALCMEAGFEARVAQEVKNTEAQLNLVAAGIGIGLLVTLPTSRYPDDIKVMPLQGVKLMTKFELLCLKSRQSEPVIKQFANIVRRLVMQDHFPMD